MGTAGGLVLIAAVMGWYLIAPENSPKDPGRHPYDVVTVERRTLSVGTSLTGRLDYGRAEPIPLRASGTVTWLPPSGARARAGDIVIKVDNRPVVLMYGTTPAYRAMDAGAPGTMPDPLGDGGQGATPARPASVGPDVEQLERGLSALGYGGFTVDQEYTGTTAAAVRAWQSDLGMAPTGRVALGDVLFLPGPVRLRPDAAALGRAVSETSVQQTGTRKRVTVQTEDASWADTGTAVRVTLPDERTVTGHVVAVSSGSSDAEAGGAGTSEVRITLDRRAPKVGPGEVTVRYVAAERRGVLVVPVTALLALAEGGYGVQLADGAFVAVKPGLYADGLVEITGDIDEGEKVRVPS